MPIYNHEKEDKKIKKDRNDMLANAVGIILGIVGFGYGIIHFAFVQKSAETMWVCIAVTVLLIGLLPFQLQKVKKNRLPENLRYQEIRDLTQNRQILNALAVDYDDEALDCVETSFGVEIGYQPNQFAYFNCLIDAKTYGFAIELMDEVYDFELLKSLKNISN